MAKGAVQNLTTWLNINAKTSGFNEAGDTLTQMGELVMTVGNQVIDYGKRSIGVYQNYQDNMLAAEGALAAKYGRDSAELKAVMEELDTAARKWASSTIFHTDDVSNAIFEVAQAGWSLEEILSGIPAAMRLAQAGGLDLSQGLEYIISTVNAADIDLDDLGNWIDVWAFAANSSAATISDFGEAMEKMGSTMKFAGSQEELVTLLAMLHNNGTKGAAAGTLLRNSMIRLIAPTKKASDVMDTLQLTEAELDDILSESNGDLDAAAEALEKVGFSAYDKDGNLKSFLEIFTELDVALKGMREEERNNILASIFPTRTITGAMNLLDAAASGFDGLYTAMMAGDAEGYGEYLSELMMSGVTGTIETVKSKFEELERRAGAAAFAEIEGVIGWVEGVLDDLNAMDDDKFQALVGGLVSIAEVGAGLTLAGSAMNIIGKVLTPGGALAVGLAGIVAAGNVLLELRDNDVGDEFGNMSLDTQMVRDYIHGIGAEFEYSQKQIGYFRLEVSGAVEDYTEASSKLSAGLVEAMLTGATLTPDDMAHLSSLGSQMELALITGISNRNAQSVEWWTNLLDPEGTGESLAYQEVMAILEEQHNKAIAEAKGYGQELRDALTAAFADGEITQEEYSRILSVYKSMNDAVARAAADAANEEAAVEMRKMLYKAQTASWDDVLTLVQEAATQRDERIKEFDEQQADEIARLGDKPSEAAIREIEQKYENMRESYNAQFADFIQKLFTTAIQTSDQGANYAWIMAETVGFMKNLGATEGTIYYNKDDYFSEFSRYLDEHLGASKWAGASTGNDSTDRAKLGEMMGIMVEALGGPSEIMRLIDYYKSVGDMDSASQLTYSLMSSWLLNNFAGTNVGDPNSHGIISFLGLGSDDYGFSTTQQGNVLYQIDYSVIGGESERRNAKYARSLSNGSNGIGTEFARSLISGNQELMELLQWIHTTDEKITGKMAVEHGTGVSTWNSLYGIEEGIESYFGTQGIVNAAKDLTRMGISWQQDADVIYELLFGVLREYAEQYTPNFTGTYVNPEYSEQIAWQMFNEGDPIEIDTELVPEYSDVIAVIEDVEGTPVYLEFVGNYEDLKEQLSILQSTYGIINVSYRAKPAYAEGGRATSASIFGEAGPEWAIPEEHSERTAELLNATRAAAGFTWPDLLARFGGLNASANHQPTTLVYSPTINATDSTDVDRVLREDKRRLDKWYEERMMRERVEVYA